MTIQPKEATNTASAFLEDLSIAVQENPISAMLIGLGALWMFVGNEKIASLSNALPATLRYVTNGVRNASIDAGADTAIGGDARTDTNGSSVKPKDEETVATISSTKRDATRAATEFGREVGQSVQENISLTLEERPLLLGVIGVGIGAGIASIFSSTSVEQKLVGSLASKANEQIRDVASQAAQRAEQVFDDVKREAADQGLTITSASEGLNNVAQKVKATATTAKESILSSIS